MLRPIVIDEVATAIAVELARLRPKERKAAAANKRLMIGLFTTIAEHHAVDLVDFADSRRGIPFQFE